MGEPLARLGDTSSHGGIIITSASKTFVNGIPVARKGDLHSCPIKGHGVTPITGGSDSVFVEGSAAARVGDSIGCGAVITSGSPNATSG